MEKEKKTSKRQSRIMVKAYQWSCLHFILIYDRKQGKCGIHVEKFEKHVVHFTLFERKDTCATHSRTLSLRRICNGKRSDHVVFIFS